MPQAVEPSAHPHRQAHLDALEDAARRRATRPAGEAAAGAARRILLDTIGCMLAGRDAPEVAALEAALSSLESGPFTFPGGRRLSVGAAAQIGALAAVWDEACTDDGCGRTGPGAAVAAALLPLALARDRGLDATADALALGYEVGARADAWLQHGPAGGSGSALGVAAGAARLIGLDAHGIVRAIDIAIRQLPAGTYRPGAAGHTTRDTTAPHSAQLGLMAAFAAQAGIGTPADVPALVDMPPAAAGSVAPPDPAADLIADACIRPHAAARDVHYGAELARLVRDELEGKTTGISRILLSIHPEAIARCGHCAPGTPLLAQCSLSFGIAAMLRFGTLDASVYRPARFGDAELWRLEALVALEVDRALADSGRRGASLAVSAGYQDIEHDVRAIPGDPSRPLSREEVAAKFMHYAAAHVPAEKSFVFANAVLAAEVDVKMGALWELLF